MYTVEVPNRAASDLLNVLRDVVPVEVTASLQHLRRFAKPEFLPRHLQDIDRKHDNADVSTSPEEQGVSSRITKSTTSHVLVCPTSAVSLRALETLFRDNSELFLPLRPTISQTTVPVFSPVSAVQATQWSQDYWPTVYKNTNPYGPHPALVRRAELELVAGGDADRYIALSHRVAMGVPSEHESMNTGAVIVERLPGTKNTRVVAVARGNINGSPCNDEVSGSNQGVLGHAVLRAISMVAQKRRALVDSHDLLQTLPSNINQVQTEPFKLSEPLCDLETAYGARLDNLSPNGYLCLDLEMYLTHEPCVMCAMAILHSRFSRVVFDQAMLKTGALCAENDSLGHGLFWREQLNWKFLAWQWQPSDAEQHEDDRRNINFHA